MKLGLAHGGIQGVDPVSQPQLYVLLPLFNQFHQYQVEKIISQGLFGLDHLYIVTSTSSIDFEIDFCINSLHIDDFSQFVVV